MIRLVYQRGEFDASQTELVADGALLVRLLAAVQRPLPAADPDLLQPPAALGADRDLRRQPGDHGRCSRRLLYEPFGVGGIVAATAIATAASVVAQAVVLRRAARPARARPLALDDGAGAARLGGRSPRSRYGDLGRCSTTRSGAGSRGQIVSLGIALAAGAVVYAARSPPCGSRRRRRSAASCAALRRRACRRCKQACVTWSQTSIRAPRVVS